MEKHKFYMKPVAGAKKMAGDCDPSCVVEGQQKGPIHSNGNSQDHEDWDAISTSPTIGDPRLDLLKSDDSTSIWDTRVKAPTRSDFDELAIQLIPRELIVNCPSIEAHKNIVYGQTGIKDIISYMDVTTRSYRDVAIIIRYFNRFFNNRPHDRQRCPSLCLVGRSGVGKTDFVRRLGDHVYFSR